MKDKGMYIYGFDLVRIIAMVFVFFNHAPLQCGERNPLFGGIGVTGFFLLGGALNGIKHCDDNWKGSLKEGIVFSYQHIRKLWWPYLIVLVGFVLFQLENFELSPAKAIVTFISDALLLQVFTIAKEFTYFGIAWYSMVYLGNDGILYSYPEHFKSTT